MDIPKIDPQPDLPLVKSGSDSLKYFLLIAIFLGLGSGFWFSRIIKTDSSSPTSSGDQSADVVDAELLSSGTQEIKIGTVYGNANGSFKDTATGKIEKGSINNIGTHILIRDGGADQRASLTSSVLDLDLFVNRRVEVKGETNASKNTGWLLDVGSVKVLE